MSSGLVGREEKDKTTGLVKTEKQQANAGVTATSNMGGERGANTVRAANTIGRDTNAKSRDAAIAWRQAKEELLQREISTGRGPQLTRRDS